MFLLCGIILAIIASVGVYSAMNKMENLVPIVVATKNIEPHIEITENMVRIEEVPSMGRPESAMEDTALVVGGYSTTRIFTGQTIIQPMVAKQFDETGASGIALSIPDENLRAISFPVSPETTVNGKIKKGDYVDIIATLDSGKLGTNTSITRTIFQGVEVFDVMGNEGTIQSLALLLTLEQAETLLHVMDVGKITFTLNPGNAKPGRTSGMINKWLCDKYGFTCSGK